MLQLKDCIVLHGTNLSPHHCYHFKAKQDTIAEIDLGEPCNQLYQGALVVIPGL
jgi:hypothetical protein